MKTEYAQEYISPSVNIIEIKARQVICQSGGTADYNDGGNTEDIWF